MSLAGMNWIHQKWQKNLATSSDEGAEKLSRVQSPSQMNYDKRVMGSADNNKSHVYMPHLVSTNQGCQTGSDAIMTY